MGNISKEPVDKVAANLGRYQELTDELKELGGIAEQHDAKVGELRTATTALKTAREEHTKLDVLQYEKAYDDWQVKQRPETTRLWAKIKGKGKGKAAVEPAEVSPEHAYEIAFTEGQGRIQCIAELEALVTLTSEQEAKLRPKHQRYDELRASLLALYEDLFGGPTPQNPEEDAAENAFILSRDNHSSLMEALAAENRTLAEYPPILECAARAEGEFKKALQKSGRGESDHFSKGFENYHRAAALERHLNARRPDIDLFPGTLSGRTWFSLRLDDKRSYCASYLKYLSAWRSKISHDISTLATQLEEAKKDMNRRRDVLEEVRCLIMDGCVEESGAGPAPPAYDDPPSAIA